MNRSSMLGIDIEIMNKTGALKIELPSSDSILLCQRLGRYWVVCTIPMSGAFDPPVYYLRGGSLAQARKIVSDMLAADVREVGY